MKAMEKNPVDRFQSAGEMLDDLDEFRRDPNLVFQYDLQTNNARYDASRCMEAYDTGRQAPSYNDDYEYEEELVRSRRSAKGAMVVKGILVAAIIVGIAVAAIYFLNYWNNRPDEGNDLIEMPNLVGQLYEDVAANEQYADFNFIVNEGNDPDKQPGEIMNQNPDARDHGEAGCRCNPVGQRRRRTGSGAGCGHGPYDHGRGAAGYGGRRASTARWRTWPMMKWKRAM